MTKPSSPIPSPRAGALVVRRAAIGRDAALRPGGRGARKLAVTERYPGSERPAAEPEWEPPAAGEACPVWEADAFEWAVFTEAAAQDRHHHARGTEIYTVLDGEMSIEVGGTVHRLGSGDSILVGPGTVHRVVREASRFVCQVLTANCGGVGDKFVEPPEPDPGSSR